MLPYHELPYGYAPAWCFPLTEICLYGFMILLVIHAWKRRNGALAYLLGGLAFGVLLEFFEVLGGSYIYGHFGVMLGHLPHAVPLCIGCGWAIILYASRLVSDAAGLPLFAAASLDTLLALNIDVSMDVVAYRLHMWHWDWVGSGLNPLTAQWFGIPYGNFIGWITVVFCYSAFSRIFEKGIVRGKNSPLRAAIVPVCALLCSLGVLIATESTIYPIMAKRFGITSGYRLLIFTALLLAVTIRGWRRRLPSKRPLETIALWVPGWFHLSFVCFFFVFGFFRENVWMTTATCLNLLIGIAVHVYASRLQVASPAHQPAGQLELGFAEASSTAQDS
jgi:hypothetical protein